MNLPPYISRTPPPLNETEDDEDEEFGTFAVCSDLGEEVCDVFEKNSHLIRGDDNVSEDSGFCMNSICQTQSPCDVSPLSSSYNKGNECMGIENNGNIVNSSSKETERSKSNDLKLNDTCFNQSSFTQEFDTFQSDEIYIEPPDAVEGLEFRSKLFENKISNSESRVDSIEKVNFVENENEIIFVDNVPVNGDILLSDNFSQDVNDSSLQESLKINEPNWFKSTCQKVKIVDNTSPENEHSKLSNNHLGLQEESTSIVQDTETVAGFPEFSTSSCSKQCNNYFSNENVYEENIELDHWGSEDDDFSDFTAFQVVEPSSERPYSEFEFQFGESELVSEETTEHIYGTLQSAIETNCLWNSLKYFEDTSAFKYQWSTSCTQMKFLQALHIDSRNILCGPWNKMNKINVADSSCSFENTYSVDTFSNTISSRNREMIPDAHFDWITSGLINPLQGTSNEKEIIHNFEEKNVSEVLKSRSQDVLSSLPNHNFLKLTYISFK